MMTSDLLITPVTGSRMFIDTPLNRGRQSAPTKIFGNVIGPQEVEQVSLAGHFTTGQATTGQATSELRSAEGQVESGHTATGQVMSELVVSELGQAAAELGRSTPPLLVEGQKVASSEEARKFRQAQQKMKKDQWMKKRGVCVGSTPEGDVAAAMMKYETELVSNGMTQSLEVPTNANIGCVDEQVVACNLDPATILGNSFVAY